MIGSNCQILFSKLLFLLILLNIIKILKSQQIYTKILNRMDKTWWMNAKGLKTENPNDFQNQVEAAGNKFIVVDFFMPMCKYCVQFMPEWNQIVDEFKEQYGEQVQFLKVDGT